MSQTTSLDHYLPDDGMSGTLIGRAWLPASLAGGEPGPSPVWVRENGIFDLTPIAATCAELVQIPSLPERLTEALPALTSIGSFETCMAKSRIGGRRSSEPHFLPPVDLQAIKACGVTFMVSMLERVIEERAAGDAGKAASVRRQIRRELDADLTTLRPGSDEAMALKAILVDQGLWSQYLEVGLGPDAEVFTKAQPMSAVGPCAQIGIHPTSAWNNPEPEVVLVVDSMGEIVGATLGNDVNLRDIEGRSALLLGKAKDNNASCAIGPFIRLFDDTFDLDDVRRSEVSLTVDGVDGYRLEDSSDMGQISRDVVDLVAQTINEHHGYPDGLVLFTGTLFAPTDDRTTEGGGFTHHEGDVVRIASSQLGCLENVVTRTDLAPPWTFGVGALMRNLGQRSLL